MHGASLVIQGIELIYHQAVVQLMWMVAPAREAWIIRIDMVKTAGSGIPHKGVS